MSGVYAYCIVEAGHRPPSGLEGLSGGPVRGYDVGPFTVWASDEAEAPPVGLEPIKRHHEVVRSAVATTTPLPLRFGGWAADADTLHRRIERRRDELEAVLAAVAGRVEFGISFVDPSGRATPPVQSGDSSEAPSDGRAYLRELSRSHAERKERKTRADELVARLRTHLDGLPDDERVQRRRPPGLVSIAHLVSREDERKYRHLVEDFLRDRADTWVAHLTGPWPPYSFTES